MFEIEKMEKEFDYSLVDSETADFLRSCEYEMNGIAEDARVKFGRVLKRVQEKLANHYNGIFVKWYESGGLDKHDVYYSINLYEISTNLENTKKDNFLNAPKSLQKEVMKKNAPKELKEKVFDGDITTNKEYQKEIAEWKKRAEQAQRKAEQAQKSEEIALRKLEEVERKEPEVITQEVIKEVIPEHIKKQIQEKDKVLQSAREEMESMQSEIDKLERLTTGMDEEAKKEKEVKLLMLDASKSVLKTKIKIDEFLQEVAVTPYRRGAIAASSQAAKGKLAEGVEELKKFIEEMELSLNATIEHH